MLFGIDYFNLFSSMTIKAKYNYLDDGSAICLQSTSILNIAINFTARLLLEVHVD